MAQNLYWAYVSYVEVSGGKRRPVLFIRQTKTDYIVFRLTSKYTNKSATIQRQYIKISDWQQAGLPKPSWIDTVKTYELPRQTTKLTYIGQLTEQDAQQIILSLNNLDQH